MPIVTALVDGDPAAAEALAARLKEAGQPEPKVYDDLAAALSGSDISLVAICTPSGTHAALAEQALDEKKHVVIEKPLDVDLIRARRLGAAATRAASHGVVSSVISQHRFDPGSALVAEAIKAGRFGQLTSAVATVAWWRSDEYYASAGWRGTWAQDGGGALMNQGVHTVDLLLWFMGRPVNIQAQAIRAAHHAIEVEDTVVATLTFESGAVATLHATTAAFPGGRTRVSVHGTEGGAELEDDLLRRFNVDGSDDDARSTRNRRAATSRSTRTSSMPSATAAARHHRPRRHRRAGHRPRRLHRLHPATPGQVRRRPRRPVRRRRGQPRDPAPPGLSLSGCWFAGRPLVEDAVVQVVVAPAPLM